VSDPAWTRRKTLCLLAAAGAMAPVAGGLGQPAGAGNGSGKQGSDAGTRWIELHNLNTNEVLKVTFHDANGFVAEALGKLQHLLRDYRTGEEHPIDTGLYLLLTDLARTAGREPRYDLICGYRSPQTNSALRAKGHHVAQHSLHTEGRAMDVRLQAMDLAAFRDLALAAKRGGVGFYPRSNFVHIDTGRARAWQDEVSREAGAR
jgi:uncharacterized protein YcbK (DUF882 family)